MIGSPLLRVSRAHPCQVCGKDSWCGYLEDGSRAFCARVREGAVSTAKNGAFVHRLSDDPGRPRGPRVVTIEAPAPDLRTVVAAAVAATPASWIEHLANRLGMPAPGGVEALRRVGAHRERPTVAGFPMTRHGRVVGIRYRSSSGSKWARKGGKEGAFVPTGIEAGAPLWLVEGPTDCAALLSVGLPTVGRPSASGNDAVVELVRTLRPSAAVVIADHDTNHDVGQRTAAELALRLVLLVPDVRTILPPGGAKDARAAIIAGARRSDFEAVAATAERCRIPPPRRLS